MSEKIREDFIEIFDVGGNIQDISKYHVSSLKEKGAEFIIVITNMDGRYSWI